MTSSFKTWLGVGLLLFAFSGHVFAATGNDKAKSHDPDPSANPVLASIVKLGAKFYFIGNTDGIDGWLIVKDGQVQFAYASPKSTHALIGALFGPNGENTSANQLQAIMTSNKELNTQLSMGMLQQQGAAADPTAAVAAAAMAQAQMAPTSAAAPMPTSAPSLLSPGERLMKDLQNAAGVNVGGSTAPLLMMIMDPNCPHCQATWRMLRDSVMKNNLQVRLIPLGSMGGDSERAAAQLLHVVDPLNGYDKYVAGDKSQLSGTPDPALTAAIKANSALVDSWHIEMTPYLLYRAKDGRVKIVQGEPEQAATLLSDIQ
jgi:thiol:disulfide interchange protein DsbG